MSQAEKPLCTEAYHSLHASLCTRAKCLDGLSVVDVLSKNTKRRSMACLRCRNCMVKEKTNACQVLVAPCYPAQCTALQTCAQQTTFVRICICTIKYCAPSGIEQSEKVARRLLDRQHTQPKQKLNMHTTPPSLHNWIVSIQNLFAADQFIEHHAFRRPFCRL